MSCVLEESEEYDSTFSKGAVVITVLSFDTYNEIIVLYRADEVIIYIKLFPLNSLSGENT
jgi:hypothetical protein